MWLTLASLCPDCQPGRDARALVLGADFLPGLSGTLVPFIIVLVLAAIIMRGIDRRW
jgi:hypothetical protein